MGKRFRKHKHRSGSKSDEHQTSFSQVFEFPVILRAVMIAEYRPDPIRIPYKHGGKNQADIHQQAINDNSVFPRVFQQLYIVDDPDKGRGGFRHEFRGAVGAAFHKGPAVPHRLHQPEEAVIFSIEIKERKYASYHLGQSRCRRRACKSPVKPDHKKRIQCNITKSRAHCDGKSQSRFFSGDKEKLELIHPYPCGQSQNKDPSVQHAVFQELPFRAQHGRDWTHKDKPQRHQQNTHTRSQGKQTVRLFLILFPQRLRNQRAASHAEHIADRSENIQHRHDQIDSSKFCFSRKIRDKKAIRNDVQGSKYVHHNGRQRKPQ